MSVDIGSGWELVHLTERVIELRKDTPVYYRFTQRPGYVRVRGEPGIDRAFLVNRALDIARENDARLTEMVAKQLMPSVVQLAKFQGKQAQVKRVIAGTGQEPEERVYRP